MAKTIEIKDGKKTYKLGFNREIVRRLNRDGFNPGEESGHRIDDMFVLIRAAFEMYNPDATEDEIFELWGRLTDKEKLYNVLMEMFVEPVNVLGEPDENAEGNLGWKVTE
jgi:hypothetical protein